MTSLAHPTKYSLSISWLRLFSLRIPLSLLPMCLETSPLLCPSNVPLEHLSSALSLDLFLMSWFVLLSSYCFPFTLTIFSWVCQSLPLTWLRFFSSQSALPPKLPLVIALSSWLSSLPCPLSAGSSCTSSLWPTCQFLLWLFLKIPCCVRPSTSETVPCL